MSDLAILPDNEIASRLENIHQRVETLERLKENKLREASALDARLTESLETQRKLTTEIQRRKDEERRQKPRSDQQGD